MICCPGLILRAYPPWIKAMVIPIKKNIFPCCILKREKKTKSKGCCSRTFTITDNTAIYHQFIPCKVEALVSQETQCELQTGEQEEIAEINQTQYLKLLHSCKHISMFSHANGSIWCMFLVHRLFGE